MTCVWWSLSRVIIWWWCISHYILYICFEDVHPHGAREMIQLKFLLSTVKVRNTFGATPFLKTPFPGWLVKHDKTPQGFSHSVFSVIIVSEFFGIVESRLFKILSSRYFWVSPFSLHIWHRSVHFYSNFAKFRSSKHFLSTSRLVSYCKISPFLSEISSHTILRLRLEAL